MPSKAARPRKPSVSRQAMTAKIARAIEAKSLLPKKVRKQPPTGEKPIKR